MDWIRANWLDALIFLLVAAIMAGVVFFLLGVNPFSGPQGNPPSPTVVAPSAPQQPAPSPPTPEPKPSTPAPLPAKPQSAPEPVVTLLPVPPAPTTPPATSKPVPAPPKVEDRKASSPPPEARAVPKAERPNTAPDFGGSWRVVVGSFANRENADRLAATLRALGYPVGLEAAGNLTRVWVGPYNSQDRARAVASTLDRYGPQVGRVPVSTPAPEASRYLQVGAFRNAQSAQAVIEVVQQAGYPVVLVEEGGLVKVRVGPLDDAPAVAAELRARGLEVLEVR